MKKMITLIILLCQLIDYCNAQSLEIHHIYAKRGDATLIIYRDLNSLRQVINQSKPHLNLDDSELFQTAIDSSIQIPKTTVCKSVLIDMGPPEAAMGIKTYMNRMGVISPDYILISHYHDDHIGGYDHLISVNSHIFDRGFGVSPDSSDVFKAYKKKLDGIPNHTVPTLGDSILIEPLIGKPKLVLKCIAVNKKVLNTQPEPITTNGINPNDFGLAWLLTYGDFKYYTGGDLGGVNNGVYVDIESSVGKAIGHVCAMKINHHGSSHSSNQQFIDSLKPYSCVISAEGKKHPVTTITNRIKKKVKKRLYITKGGHDYIYIIADNERKFQVWERANRDNYKHKARETKYLTLKETSSCNH